MSWEWLTTAPNPRQRNVGEPRGWKLHAVKATAATLISTVARSPSACGHRPPHGWDLDLFITKKCARCLIATGLACPLCRGKGSTGTASTNTWEPCRPCLGTGERKG